jgi:hypothetical protein
VKKRWRVSEGNWVFVKVAKVSIKASLDEKYEIKTPLIRH